MPIARTLVALALSFPALLASSLPARAAESYDNCTAFVDSMPATITTQGTWCLRKDLATAITSGVAITIAANNVTLDCNDFKVGGLAAGSASSARGISATERQNITVRNCGLRGFHTGISLYGGMGHLVEANRFDNNLVMGIYTGMAGNSVVRGNRIYDTGGHASNSTFYGIESYGGDGNEIVDNTVAGVVGTPGYFNSVIGIYRGNYLPNASRVGAHITGNRISGLVPTGSGMTATGFYNTALGSTFGYVLFAGNHLVQATSSSGSRGAYCIYSGDVTIRDNTIRGFATNFDAACLDGGGNFAN